MIEKYGCKFEIINSTAESHAYKKLCDEQKQKIERMFQKAMDIFVLDLSKSPFLI